VRHDTYATPPLPWSQATELDWIVTSDLAGRFEGVAVDFDEPGASARTLGWFLGLGCAVVATLVAGWAALFVLLRVGSRRPVDAEDTPAR
jgi:hypothetical protein